MAFKAWDSIVDKEKRWPWFKTILRRRFAEYLRQSQKDHQTDQVELENLGYLSDSEAKIQNKDICRRIIEEIRQEKNKTKRDALVSFFIESRPLKDIAFASEVKVSTLTTWCNRFRSKIKDVISPESLPYSVKGGQK